MTKGNVTKPNRVTAKVKAIRVSHRKLNLVAGLIRDMKADKAMAQLTFNKRKVAKDIKY
jgi:large subunit ribosomal protein L22